MRSRTIADTRIEMSSGCPEGDPALTLWIDHVAGSNQGPLACVGRRILRGKGDVTCA